MIRSLWIAKTGLDAQQTQLDVISNNLANVGTTGFKRSRAVFEDLMYQNLRQPGSQAPIRPVCRPVCKSVPGYRSSPRNGFIRKAIHQDR